MRFLFFISLVYAFQGNAQIVQPNLISKNEVTTIAYWSIGDKVSYHLTRKTESFKNDKKKPTATQFSEYDLLISVLDSTDSTYLLRMTYRNRGNDNSMKSKQTYPYMLDGYSIDYLTDEYGAYDSITNMAELVLIVKDQYKKSKLDTDAQDFSNTKVSDSAEEIFNDVDLLRMFFEKDIVFLHSIFGWSLKLENPIDLEVEYPPLRNVQMLGEGKINLKTIDKDRDYCRILMTQKPYKNEINAFLSELITQFIPVNSDKLDLKECSFNSSSKLSYEMQLSTGWMLRMTDRTTILSKVKKKQSKLIVTTGLELN